MIIDIIQIHTLMKISKLQRSKFPSSLLELPQPPENLYYLGNIEEYLENPDLIYLCIVGSRKYTSYGKDICEKIITGLKGYPIVIVSGFAMGIDTIAHRTAIKNNMRTVVFPGSGLSKEAIFPKINANFMDEILNAGGCFISEWEPDFKAERWTFPMRNRLMAGISKAVLVIEAEEKSGTLITARLAIEYNKDLLAVPGSVFSSSSKGTNKLLRLGAVPITSAEDVLQELGFELRKDENKQLELFKELSIDEKKVLEILRDPMERDDLLRSMKMPIQNANTLISVMEIKGLIKEELGQIRSNF